MRSPVRALLWERWRRTRWGIFAGLGFVPAMLLGAKGLTHFARYSSDLEEFAGTFVVLGFFVFIGYLLLAHCERDDIYPGIPGRLFRLPIRTRTLVTAWMTYNFVAALAYAVLFVCLQAIVCEAGSRLSLGELTAGTLIGVLAILAGVSAWQALFWVASIAPRRWSLALAFGLLVASPFMIANAVFWRMPVEPGVFLRLVLHFVLRLAAIAAIAWAISFSVVARNRHGGILGFVPKDMTGTRGSCRRGRFRSPLHAQAWFEFRRRGWLPFLCFAAMGGLTSVFYGALTGHFGGGVSVAVESFLLFLCTFVPVVALWSAGMLSFTLKWRDRGSGMGAFTHTRPVSTRVLSLAQLWALLPAVVVFACITLVAQFVVAPLVEHRPEGIAPSFFGAGAFVLSMAVIHTLGMWIAFWLAAPLFCLTLIGLPIEALIALFVDDASVEIGPGVWLAPQFAWAVAAVGLGLVLLRHGWRREFVRRPEVIVVTCAWLCLVAPSAAYLVHWWLHYTSEMPSVVAPLALLFGSAAPLPIVGLPLWLARERHR